MLETNLEVITVNNKQKLTRSRLTVHSRLSGLGNSSIGLLHFGGSLPSVTFEIDLFGLIVAMLGMCECVGMTSLLGEQL
jgi:hypothetical protein